MWPLKCVCIL